MKCKTLGQFAKCFFFFYWSETEVRGSVNHMQGHKDSERERKQTASALIAQVPMKEAERNLSQE